MSESFGSTSGSVDSIDSLEGGTPSRTLEQELSEEYVVHTITGRGRKNKGFRRRTLGLPPAKDDSASQIPKIWYRSPTEVGAKKAKKPGFGKVEVQDDYDFHQKFLIREEVFGDPSEGHGGGGHGGLHHGPEKVAGWELWWVQSPLWRRMLLLLCVVYFFLALLQFCFAMFLFGTSSRQKVEDPPLCLSKRCRSLSTWLNGSKDESVSPCEDFYNFTCGNHRPEDVGALFSTWRYNFLHVEADGANGRSIVAKLLMKKYTPGGMGEKMVKYYKTCLRRWAHPSHTEMGDMLTYAVHYVFKDTDMTKKDPFELEIAFARIVEVLGDSPFSKILAPASPPDFIISVYTWNWHIQERNVKYYLPFIFNSLQIHSPRDRYIISRHLYFLGGKLDAILHHGHSSPCHPPPTTPEGQELCKADPLNDFDFLLPYYLAFYGRVEGFKRYKEDENKPPAKKSIVKKSDPLQGTQLTQRVAHIEKCWNFYTNRRFNNVSNSYYYRKASYLTLFSLRLLIEISHETMDSTAIAHRMHLPSNAFFSIFQSRYFRREKEARCFESLLDSMGYLPVYRFLSSSNSNDTDRFTYEEVMGVITHARDAVREAFSPPEVGGLGHVSSRYRERILRTLASDTNIMIPYEEDDEEFLNNKGTPPVTSNHIQNVFAWREYTNGRFLRSWLNFDPKSKIIWHSSFYRVDRVNVYEAPSISSTHLIKFPTAMFLSPYWRNDLPIANYAGARVIATKGWLRLILAEFHDSNIAHEIEIKTKSGEGTFYEGIVSDGDFTPCSTVTYDWFHPGEEKVKGKGYENTRMDPHFFSFRCGSKEYKNGNLEGEVKFGNAGFIASLALRIMFKKGFEELGTFRGTDEYWYYSARTRAFLSKKKLPGYEDYTEEQLLFMIHMRALCRSPNDGNKAFLTHHSLESNVGLMQYSKFAEVWNCPKGYPMNPLDQCFSKHIKEK